MLSDFIDWKGKQMKLKAAKNFLEKFVNNFNIP